MYIDILPFIYRLLLPYCCRCRDLHHLSSGLLLSSGVTQPHPLPSGHILQCDRSFC